MHSFVLFLSMFLWLFLLFMKSIAVKRYRYSLCGVRCASMFATKRWERADIRNWFMYKYIWRNEIKTKVDKTVDKRKELAVERILRYHKKQLKHIWKQVLSSLFYCWNVVYYVKKSERADACVWVKWRPWNGYACVLWFDLVCTQHKSECEQKTTPWLHGDTASQQH